MQDSGAFAWSTNAIKGGNTGASEKQFMQGLGISAAMASVNLIVGAAIYGLSKLLGIGKVKFEAVGGGIVMNAQKFLLDGMQQEVTVFDYSKVKKTVTGLFSDDVTYFDVINRIDIVVHVRNSIHNVINVLDSIGTVINVRNGSVF